MKSVALITKSNYSTYLIWLSFYPYRKTENILIGLLNKIISKRQDTILMHLVGNTFLKLTCHYGYWNIRENILQFKHVYLMKREMKLLTFIIVFIIRFIFLLLLWLLKMTHCKIQLLKYLILPQYIELKKSWVYLSSVWKASMYECYTELNWIFSALLENWFYIWEIIMQYGKMKTLIAFDKVFKTHVD